MRDEHGIQAEKLAREYKGGIKAVDGIDLRIAPGEIFGFLGPNGAGKSTTVHMLTTLLPPASGTARVAGFDIVKQGPQVRASIGAALQEAALDPFLTGREHLRLQASLHGLSTEERKRRSEELLERVGLTRDVEAGDMGGAVRDGKQGREHPHGGRLPGAVRAEEAEDLAVLDTQVDAAHRVDGVLPASIRLHEPFGDDRAHRARH